MTTKITSIALLLALSLGACDQASCTAASNAAKPTLDAVMARADVPRLLECAAIADLETAAKCLGAEALTLGLEVALERAANLAEQARDASNPQAGAADLDASQRAALAADLNDALDELAREIAASRG